jgi:cell wall-associated NlpC family hydrolase
MADRHEPAATQSRRRSSRGVAVAFVSLALASAAQGQQAAGNDTATAPSVQKLEHAKPFGALSSSALGLRDSLVRMARAQVGRRYVLGGTTPERGFDCSGLVRYVMAALRLELPRTAASQARAGTSIGRDTAQLRPGDLLTFGKGRRVSHVGIYIGEGRYVHASSVAGRVIESPIDRPPTKYVRRWYDSRRVVPADSGMLAQQP